MAAVSFVSPAPSERVDPEDSVHNADKRGKATAESFNGLMTISRQQTTRLEREQTRKSLQEQADKVRAQIRKTHRCTLDPHSRAIQRWDMVTTIALLFTATVTPFEVGIFEPNTLAQMVTDPLAWINRIVDIVFFIDIVAQCFIAFQETGDSGGSWVVSAQLMLCSIC